MGLNASGIDAFSTSVQKNPASILYHIDFSQNNFAASSPSQQGQPQSAQPQSAQSGQSQSPQAQLPGSAGNQKGAVVANAANMTALLHFLESLQVGVSSLILRKTGMTPQLAAMLFQHFHNNEVVSRCIRNLDVSENTLGSQGVNAFSTWLKNADNLPMTTLNVAYCSVPAAAIADLMLATPGTRCLRSLNISGTVLDFDLVNRVADALRVRRTIVSVAINDCRATAAGIVKVLGALSEGRQMINFEASSNDVTVEDGCVLAEALEKYQNVRKLALAGNHLSSGSLFLIVKALSLSKIIEQLDISKNLELAKQRREADMTRLLGQALFGLFSQHQNMHVLRIAGDREKGLGGGRNLVESIATLVGDTRTNVYSLDVSENSAGDQAMADLYGALEPNETLEELNSDGNDTALRGLRSLVTLMSRNHTIARVKLPTTDISNFVKSCKNKNEQRDVLSYFSVASQQIRISLNENIRAKLPKEGTLTRSQYALWIEQCNEMLSLPSLQELEDQDKVVEEAISKMAANRRQSIGVLTKPQEEPEVHKRSASIAAPTQRVTESVPEPRRPTSPPAVLRSPSNASGKPPPRPPARRPASLDCSSPTSPKSPTSGFPSQPKRSAPLPPSVMPVVPQRTPLQPPPMRRPPARSGVPRHPQQQRLNPASVPAMKRSDSGNSLVEDSQDKFVFTADNSGPGASSASKPTPTLQVEEEEDEGRGQLESEEEEPTKSTEEEEAPPPPPMFQADAILQGNSMSLFRDRRLQRKSMALRAAWWTETDEDLASNPIVPLLPGTDFGSAETDEAPPPLVPLGQSTSMSLDLSDVDVSAPPQPLI